MSSLSFPLQQSILRNSPTKAMEYMSPSKRDLAIQAAVLNISRSPHSATNSLNHYYDLQNELDKQYLNDLTQWKSKAQEADIRRDILEIENKRLETELSYLRSQGDINRLVELEVAQSLNRSAVQNMKRSYGSQQDLLDVEIESLRNQLIHKMREVDEWRTIYFNQELRSALRSTTEAQLKDYEYQMSQILKDIQAKIDLSSELEKQNANLQDSTSKLNSVKDEVNDFQNLLNYNLEESKRLRDEVTDKEIENYKLRKNELKLKEQERNLLTQIKIIQNNINETNTLKEMEQRRADKVHDSMLEKIKNDHEQLKETLDQKRLSYQDLINEKEKNLEELRQNVENVRNQIDEKRQRGNSLKRESEEQKERQRSIDRQRESEVTRIRAEREKSLEALRQAHEEETNTLEGKINELRGDLNTKEDLIAQQQTGLYRSRLERNNLEVEKRALENEVEVKRLMDEQKEKDRQIQLQVKDRVHERTVGALRSSSKYERERLEQEEKVLNSILESKQAQVAEEKQRADRYLLESMQAERKEREKSLEANKWKTNYTRTEREKSLDAEVARSLRQSQLDALRRSHDAEQAIQSIHNASLLGVLDSKQSEIRNLRDSQSHLMGEYISTQADVNRANLEAQIWKSRADIEERDKNVSLLASEIAKQTELEALRRSQELNSHLLRSEINHINNSIDLKSREALDWRSNYSRLYNNSFRR